MTQDTSELALAFPDVDCGQDPLGTRVIVQIRRVKQVSAGKIILVQDTKETEKWNTTVARLVKLGPLAFKNRNTGEAWPEGMWASVGDFVRVPRWGGDRWEIPIEGEDEPALFVVFNDHELITKVTGDPLKIKAFIL